MRAATADECRRLVAAVARRGGVARPKEAAAEAFGTTRAARLTAAVAYTACVGRWLLARNSGFDTVCVTRDGLAFLRGGRLPPARG